MQHMYLFLLKSATVIFSYKSHSENIQFEVSKKTRIGHVYVFEFENLLTK